MKMAASTTCLISLLLALSNCVAGRVIPVKISGGDFRLQCATPGSTTFAATYFLSDWVSTFKPADRPASIAADQCPGMAGLALKDGANEHFVAATQDQRDLYKWHVCLGYYVVNVGTKTEAVTSCTVAK